MPTTASGISYPTLADPPDVPGYMQAMAASIELLIATPLCKLILPANFGLPNGSNSVVLPYGAGSENIKTHAGMHSVSVNNSRITPTVPGYYEVAINTSYAVSTSGFRTHTIGKNGVRQASESGIYNSAALPSGANTVLPPISLILSANGTTDYFEHFAFQNSGGTLNAVGDGTTTNTVNCMFSCKYLRPL